MANTGTDKIQLEVVVDGSPARKELAELKQAARGLSVEQERLNKALEGENNLRRLFSGDKTSADYKKAAKAVVDLTKELNQNKGALKANEARQNELRDSIGLTGLSLNEIRAKAIALRKTFSAGVLDNQAALDNARALAEVERRMQQLGTAAGRALLVWEEDRKGIDLNRMSLEQLGLELRRYEQIRNTSEPNSNAYNEASAAIDRVRQRQEELTSAQVKAQRAWEEQRRTLSLNQLSLEQLALEEERLKAIMANPATGEAERIAAAKAIGALRDRTKELTDVSGAAAREWRTLRDTLTLDSMSVDQLKLEIDYLKQLRDGLPPTGAAFQEAAAKVTAAEQRLKALTNETERTRQEWLKLREGLRLEDMNLDQLKLEVDTLKQLRDVLPPTSAEYAKLDTQLLATERRLKELGNETGRSLREWEQLRKGLTLDQLSIDQLKLEKQYLEDLRNTLQRTDPALKKVEQDLQQVEKALQDATSATAVQDRQWEAMRQSIKLTDMSMEQLELEARRLKKELATLNPNDARFEPLRRDLVAVDKQMSFVRTGLGPFGRAWAEVRTQVMSAGAVLGAVFAGGALIQGFRNLVTGAGKVSDELANIQKATGLSAQAVRQLNKEIAGIDTRTATTDLREIAVGLGQAGQAATRDSIAAIDKINVALGDEFGESSKDIANTLSVLRNGFADIKSGDYGTDVLRIGNALNELGANGLATAPIISDIAKRVAGAATQYNIASGDVLGLAATFQELGINVERGSTAYIRVLNKIAGEPEKFAAIVRAAGLDVDLFRKQVETDLQAAFVTAARAAKIAGTSNTDFAKILDSLGTEGVGVSELLSKIGQNAELLADKSKLATTALQETTSITAEFNTKNNTLQAQLDKLGKEFARVFSSSTIQDGLRSLVGGLREAIAWVRANKDGFVVFGKVLLTVISSWGAYRLVVLAKAAAERLSTAASASQSAVMLLLSGRINLATAAMRAFNAVSKVNVFGAIVSGITAATALFLSFRKEVQGAASSLDLLNEAEKEQFKTANALYYKILATNEGTAQRKKLIEELKAIYPQYLSQIDAETASNADLARGMAEVNRQLIYKGVIAKQEEKNAALRETASNQLAELYDREKNTYDLLSRAAQKYGVDAVKAVDGATNAYEAAVQTRQAIVDANRAKGGRGFFPELIDIDNAITELGAYKGLYDRKEQIALEGERELQAMLKRYGINNAITPDDKRSLDDYKKELAALEKEIEAFRASITADTDVSAGSPTEQKALELKKRREELLAAIKQFENAPAAAGDTPVDPLATGAATKQKTEEDLQKHVASIQDILRKAQEDQLQDRLSADERELRQLDLKHADERAKVVEAQQALRAAGKLDERQAAEDLRTLQQAQNTARVDLLQQQAEARRKLAEEADARYLEERKGAEQKVVDATWKAHLESLQNELDYWEQRIQLAQQNGEDTTVLEQQRYAVQRRLIDAESFAAVETQVQQFDALIALAKQYSIDTTDLERERNAALKLLGDRRRLEEKSAEQKHRIAMRAIVAQRLRDLATIGGGLNDLVGGIQQYRQAEVDAAEQAADADGVRTAQELQRIEERKRAQREAALVAIAVQGAAALANGVASAMTLTPWPAAVAAALSTVGIVIGLMAQARSLLSEGGSSSGANAAQNVSVNNVPLGERGMALRMEPRRQMVQRMAQGGRIDSGTGGGVLGGSRHSEGGNVLYDSRTGQPLAEVEQGELMLVMSRAATEANLDLIPLMLEASRKGERLPLATGEAPMPRMALAPMPMPNPERVGQAMRVAYMATGGVVMPDSGYDTAAGQKITRGTALVNGRDPGGSGDPGRIEALLEELVRKTDENTKATLENRHVLFTPNAQYDRTIQDWSARKARVTTRRA